MLDVPAMSEHPDRPTSFNHPLAFTMSQEWVVCVRWRKTCPVVIDHAIDCAIYLSDLRFHPLEQSAARLAAPPHCLPMSDGKARFIMKAIQ